MSLLFVEFVALYQGQPVIESVLCERFYLTPGLFTGFGPGEARVVTVELPPHLTYGFHVRMRGDTEPT